MELRLRMGKNSRKAAIFFQDLKIILFYKGNGMITISRTTRRPRNLNPFRAAGFLYGDLGTSKAYVIGLAFAIAGYASFWLIALVSLLSILIGINYMVVCKYYPNGGGVYASLRNRSRIVSLIGAFFLSADYIVTASLSALSAFYYLGVPDPALFAILGLFCLGVINFWGARHVGGFASIIALVAVGTLFVLALFAIPHLQQGWENIQPLHKTAWGDWTSFVTVILTLSGIETIANMTGIMTLDPGSTLSKPSVKKTSRKAISYVIFEIAFFTTFFSLALSSLNGLTVANEAVFTPDHQDIRDYVLRYLGTTFVGQVLGAKVGIYFGYFLSIIFGILLLSAANTAINGLISLQYLMSQDGEVPKSFRYVNRYGVPILPYLIAVLSPILILIFIHNIVSLAALYAIGFVGAIAMNLGSMSTDPSLPMLKKERVLLFGSFLIMGACEITLFINKPGARTYVLVIATLGLILRGLAIELKAKKEAPHAVAFPTIHEGGILCVVHACNRAFDHAVQIAQKIHCPLYFLFVREQKYLSERDFARGIEEDKRASILFALIGKNIPADLKVDYLYAVSDSPATTIANYAKRLKISQLIVDFPRRGAFRQMLRGDIIREIRPLLPDEIQYFIIPS